MSKLSGKRPIKRAFEGARLSFQLSSRAGEVNITNFSDQVDRDAA